MLWDLDGSATGQAGGSYLLPYKAHLEGLCERKVDWDDSLVCLMSSVVIRDMVINNPQPGNLFSGAELKVFRVKSTSELATAALSEFSVETSYGMKRNVEQRATYSTLLALGHTYNFHWKLGINFDHLALQAS